MHRAQASVKSEGRQGVVKCIGVTVHVFKWDETPGFLVSIYNLDYLVEMARTFNWRRLVIGE